MNKVDIKIMAVKPRRKMVLAMLEKMGLSEADTVIYDDREHGGGTLYTCRKCWEAPIAEGITHRLVLQDDLLLCNNFVEIINRIANAQPEFVFTLFCPRMKFEYALSDSPYVIVKGRNAWGQGMMMPIDFIKPMFEFADRQLGKDFPFDDGIYSWWAVQEGIQIMTTVPSTIQHLCPTESTLGYNNSKKISKVWTGEDLSGVNWDSRAFTFSPSMPTTTSFKEIKKQIAEKGNNPNPYTIFRENGGNRFEDMPN